MKTIKFNDFMLGYRNGTYDESVIEEVLASNHYKFDFDKKYGLIIDIGANIGAFSVPASINNEVWAYEPEPNNFEMLKYNRKINEAKFHISMFAIGKSGACRITNQTGCSHLTDDGTEYPVKVVSLNKIIKKPIDFLKCDCEGSEYDIIKYASDKTLRKIKSFAMEVHRGMVDKDAHEEFIKRLQNIFTLEYDTSSLEKYGNEIVYGVKK